MSHTTTVLNPFRIAPRFVERVWGTYDLRPWFDHVAVGEPVGEVWLNGDDCLVETGPLAGLTVSSIFEQYSEAILGSDAAPSSSPLLLKIIYAKSKLSVQVHPDDALAQKYGEPRGKTECWYALSAQPGAQVACGLNPGVSLDTVRKGIVDGTLEESLQMLDVAAGDTIFVDAGTVHAIWPGSVLLETQQNCDLTYRMYDYGRPRQLHVEKSIEAIRLETKAGKIQPKELPGRTILVEANYFCVERMKQTGKLVSQSLLAEGKKAGLAYLFAAAGSARIESLSGEFEPVLLPARGLVAIPASSSSFVVVDQGGLDLIRITPNWPGTVSYNRPSA
jgi:mannose-6-phosphate isomerase